MSRGICFHYADITTVRSARGRMVDSGIRESGMEGLGMGDDSMAGIVADFYNGLVEKKVPRDVAIQLTLGWINAALLSWAQKNKEKSSDLMVEWLSKTTGGVGNG